MRSLARNALFVLAVSVIFPVMAVALQGCGGVTLKADLAAIDSAVRRFDASKSQSEPVPKGTHRNMYEGDGVNVDQSGYAKLNMEGCILKIYRSTDLQVEGIPSESVPVCVVRFTQGTIYNQVEKQMIINTEWAVITALGTDFVVHLDPNREIIWLIVKDGVVQVEAAGQRVEVRADQQTWVQRGHAPRSRRPISATR